MPSYILHAAVFAMAAFAIGLTGYGFGLIAMGALPFFMEVPEASALVAVLALPVTVAAAIPIRRSVHVRRLLPLLAGAAVGVPLGVLYLVRIDESLLRVSLGSIILIAVAVSIYGSLRARKESRDPADAPSSGPGRSGWGTIGGVLVGILSGSFGGAFSVSGPPVVLYLNEVLREKASIKATLVAYFTFVIASRIPFLIVSGVLTGPLMIRASLLLPVVAVALVGGTALHHALPSRVIRWIIQLLLTASAISLLSGAS